MTAMKCANVVPYSTFSAIIVFISACRFNENDTHQRTWFTLQTLVSKDCFSKTVDFFWYIKCVDVEFDIDYKHS